MSPGISSSGCARMLPSVATSMSPSASRGGLSSTGPVEKTLQLKRHLYTLLSDTKSEGDRRTGFAQDNPLNTQPHRILDRWSLWISRQTASSQIRLSFAILGLCRPPPNCDRSRSSFSFRQISGAGPGAYTIGVSPIRYAVYQGRPGAQHGEARNDGSGNNGDGQRNAD